MGVDRTYPLWNNISASESFPPQVKSAFYILSVTNSVDERDEVAEVEVELIYALKLLATAWPFSGGSFMILDSPEVLASPRFASNAERVRAELLAATGRQLVSRSFAMPVECSATYHHPPLEFASAIATAAKSHLGLRRLLAYQQAAWVGYYGRARSDRTAWFVDLYKIRDLLKKLYGGEEAAKVRLAATESDWSFFGQILNHNDLRHAELAGVVPQVAEEDVRRLYRLVREWIRSHLRASGLAST